MLVPGKPFQLSLMFVGKARGGPERWFSRVGSGLTHKTIDSAVKACQDQMPLAYFENLQVTAVKSFITLAPGSCSVKTFHGSN